MSLKLSLTFQVLGFVCDLDFIVIFPLILMQTGKTKWSSMTVVETTLNMIMNHVYMNIRIYDNVYLHYSKLQRRKYCLDLEVRNMKAF